MHPENLQYEEDNLRQTAVNCAANGKDFILSEFGAVCMIAKFVGVEDVEDVRNVLAWMPEALTDEQCILATIHVLREDTTSVLNKICESETREDRLAWMDVAEMIFERMRGK
jgi:hypothetical protein